MELVIGTEYYFLTNDDYLTVVDLYGSAEGFVQGADTNWYRSMTTPMDDDFYDFLLTYNFLQTEFYSSSTQPGGNL